MLDVGFLFVRLWTRAAELNKWFSAQSSLHLSPTAEKRFRFRVCLVHLTTDAEVAQAVVTGRRRPLRVINANILGDTITNTSFTVVIPDVADGHG